MFLSVEHRLRLEYDSFIRESFIELRLQPKTLAHQTVGSFTLAVGPPTAVHRYRDWNENLVHHLTIAKFHERIEVKSRSLVSTHPVAPFLASVADAPSSAPRPYHFHDWLSLEGPLTPTPRLRKFARAARPAARGRLAESVLAYSAHLHRHFAYQKNVTRYDSTPDDFLKAGGGVCQDFTHVMLALLRLDGIPCRYVSGYLHVDSPKEPSQSHAWIEIHSPTHGWVPFDPTHNRDIDERYVVVAYGRHYDDVAPNKGIYRGTARETMHAEVRTTVVPSEPLAMATERVEPIDVPVFQEMPERRPERLTPADIAAVQQQQQQQEPSRTEERHGSAGALPSGRGAWGARRGPPCGQSSAMAPGAGALPSGRGARGALRGPQSVNRSGPARRSPTRPRRGRPAARGSGRRG